MATANGAKRAACWRHCCQPSSVWEKLNSATIWPGGLTITAWWFCFAQSKAPKLAKGDPGCIADFRWRVRELFGVVSASASVRSRADTGSSRDVVLSDFGTEASKRAGNLIGFNRGSSEGRSLARNDGDC